MTGFAELTHVTALCEPGDRYYISMGLFCSLKPQVRSSVSSSLSPPDFCGSDFVF